MVATESRARFRQPGRRDRFILLICTPFKRELVSDPSLHDWALCRGNTLSITPIIILDVMPAIKTLFHSQQGAHNLPLTRNNTLGPRETCHFTAIGKGVLVAGKMAFGFGGRVIVLS